MNHKKCSPLCQIFTGGEIKHDKTCVFYGESLSKILDDIQKESRPIYFLDIDGVFNCQLFYESTDFKTKKESKKLLRNDVKKSKISKLDYYKTQICPKRIQWFNTLCEETNAVVVISSTWRLGKSLNELKEIFNYCGGNFNIISKTEHLGYERGVEISKWIKDNVNIDTYGCHYFNFNKYVIIDDDSDMLLSQKDNFFQTDSYSGLTPNICYKIKRFIISVKNTPDVPMH